MGWFKRKNNQEKTCLNCWECRENNNLEININHKIIKTDYYCYKFGVRLTNFSPCEKWSKNLNLIYGKYI